MYINLVALKPELNSNPSMKSTNEYWNTIFTGKEDHEFGWYEEDATQTLKFVRTIPRFNEAMVFLPGAGSSILVNELISQCRHLVLNDISDVAIQRLKEKIKDQHKITLLRHDISMPLPEKIPMVDIWIDRDVLHFLLEEREIEEYFRNLCSRVKIGGYVLFAEFAPDSASMCAGLELHRYSIDEMIERVGVDFLLLKHERYDYINPFSDRRPYIYALFKRSKTKKG